MSILLRRKYNIAPISICIFAILLYLDSFRVYIFIINTEKSSTVIIDHANNDNNGLALQYTQHNGNYNNEEATKSTAVVKTEETLAFVIHVGPPKTGTTAIQCALRTYEDYLVQDKYRIIETENCRPDINDPKYSDLVFTKGGIATYDNVVRGHSFLPNCLLQQQYNNHQRQYNDRQRQIGQMPQCWKDSYMKYIDELKSQNMSIIISQEILSDAFYNLSKSQSSYIIDTMVNDLVEDFKITILVGYRPWFDWMMSARNEEYKKWSNPLRAKWQFQGGYNIPSPMSYMESHIHDFKWPFASDIIPIFKKYTGNQIDIKIMDITDGSDIIESLFCNVLKFANGTCEFYHKTQNGKMQDNLSQDLWYDAVIVQAVNEGLLNPQKIRRKRAFQLTAKHYMAALSETNSNKYNLTRIQNLNYICPSMNEYENILQQSLRYEKIIFPIHMHAHLERKHRKLFEQSKKKFCELNATKLLEDENWRNFFMKLNNRLKNKKDVE